MVQMLQIFSINRVQDVKKRLRKENTGGRPYDLSFLFNPHVCIYCHRPLNMSWVEHVVLEELDDDPIFHGSASWSHSNRPSEEPIPPSKVPIIVKYHWAKHDVATLQG